VPLLLLISVYHCSSSRSRYHLVHACAAQQSAVQGSLRRLSKCQVFAEAAIESRDKREDKKIED
jgi:hypothetical protein